MRALVVGGNGFIGSTLVLRLLSEGYRVRVLDRGTPRSDVDWGGIEYQRGDLTDPVTLDHAVADTDIVFHLASTTVPGTSNLDPHSDVTSNLLGTLNLLASMRRVGVRRLVFLSSGGTVYGNAVASPVSEDAPLNPISSYGVVKVAIEKYLNMYASLGEISPLIIRPANPYGPRQSVSGQQGAIAVFLGKALRGEPIEIWGDGTVVRDYVYVDDLVDMVAMAVSAGATGTFNAGSGSGYSLRAVCDAIQKVCGAPLRISYREARKFDVRSIVLDITAAGKAFGWSPGTGLEEGLRRTWRNLVDTRPQILEQ
ncbi:MAG TPA: NAD-dependent epimerase/dehydratase family protein [Luteimonas sp.]|nr:NAD-dependent epimerase/dehydratase family protein [Luteimonas sp.]